MEDKNILPYNMNEKFENKSVSCIVRVDMCSYEKDPFTTQHTHGAWHVRGRDKHRYLLLVLR